MEDFQGLIPINNLHNLTFWLVLFTCHIAIHVLFYKDDRSRGSCRETSTSTINLESDASGNASRDGDIHILKYLKPVEWLLLIQSHLTG